MIEFILDDDQSMAYLNDWDKKIPNLDVVDDYRSERKEIQACRGKDIPFSFGDVSHINRLNRHFIDLCFHVVHCKNSIG